VSKYRDAGVLLLLAAIWGFSFIFIRVAVPAFGPIGLSLARVVIGSLGLLAWAAARGGLSQIPRIDRRFLILATMNALIPYSMIALAELHISASLSAVLNATTPLFAAVLVASLARERLGWSMSIGLTLGMVGVGILVGWSPIPLNRTVLLSVLALLVASASYAGATVYAKRRLVGVSSFSMAIGQQIAATALLLPLGAGSMAVSEADKPMSAKAVWAIIALGLICTSVAYLLYFHLINTVGAVGTASVTFLIPIFGIFWGWLFLDEEIHLA
jgi:drug/metabolite transporter (DMT)-like permease